MTKRLLTLAGIALLALAMQAQSGTFETASEAAANMKVGWNLGNTLDAHETNGTNVTRSETNRGQPLTQPALMQMFKEAGFNAIRVPVTWYPHMDSSGTVDAAWMARVKEVVDYVIGQDMYCIINVHHDTGVPNSTTPNKGWLRAEESNYAANKAKFEYLWTQIAETFKDYGQLLLFEGYNEMLDAYGSWNYASSSANDDKYDEGVATSAYNAINAYADSFVKAVRATGGNNLQRNLIVNTYAAASGRGTWRTSVKEPLSRLEIPEGESEHIAVEVHTYPVLTTTDEESGSTINKPMESIRAELDDMFDALQTHIVEGKGVPVIFGEWATSNVDADASETDYTVRRELLLETATYFMQQATDKGMPAFYWMGLSNRADRALPAFTQPDLAQTILQGYYGENYYPFMLVRDDYGELFFAINYFKQYGEMSLYNGSVSDCTGVELIFQENVASKATQIKIYSGNTQVSKTIGSDLYVGGDLSLALNFSDVTANPVDRVTLQWKNAASGTVKLKNVYLLRADGTKLEAEPSTTWWFHDCWIAAQSNNNTTNFTRVPIGSSKYATLYYARQAFIIPEGVTATAYKVSGGKLQSVKTYEAGSVLPRQTGVVLNSTAPGTYKFSHTDARGTAATGNMLKGSDIATTTSGGAKYYKLSLNSANEEGTVGFYYGAPDGGAFKNGAHKAYLAVPESEARIAGFALPTEEDLTVGIGDVAARVPATDGAWFSLDGRRLREKPAAGGLYISGGKKVFLP